MVTSAATVGYEWVTRAKAFPFPEGLALLMVLYTAGARGVSRRHQTEVAGLVALTIGLGVAVVAASGPLKGSTVSTDVQPPLAALAAGYLVARQQSLSRQLSAAIARLHSEEELRASAVAAKERNRVARELHDVVTHGVSAMVVQAGAARITMEAEPDVAAAALRDVVTAGRSAIDELRRVVGELQPDSAEVGGHSGLAGVPTLVAGWQAAGLPVELDSAGWDTELPDLVDATCYRVIQEALTNVVKHAPGAQTSVSVVVESGAVELSVRNQAASEATELFAPRSGHGLVGMAERVESCAGRLTFGPRGEGGFEVHAHIPVTGANGRPAPPPLPLVERVRSLGPWPGVVVALAVLCADAAVSSSRRGGIALNLCLCAAMSVMLLGRRRFPVLFLIAVNVVAFPISNGLTSIDKSTLVSTYVFAIPVWAVAADSELRIAIVGLAVAIGFEAAEAIHWSLGGGAVVGNALVCVALWAAGRVWRTQERVVAELAEARARVEAGQRARAELSLTATRSDMVRELDGLVLAQVAAMVAEAEALQQSIRIDGASSAPNPIGQIEDSGRQALGRLREILGLLRTELDPGPLSPSLGVEQLDRLIGDYTRSGHPTRFEVIGEPVPLVRGADLVAYRVIVDVLAHADCHTVALHFDAGGWLRLRFDLAKPGAVVTDPGLRAEVEHAGGSFERTSEGMMVRIPLAAVALA